MSSTVRAGLVNSDAVCEPGGPDAEACRNGALATRARGVGADSPAPAAAASSQVAPRERPPNGRRGRCPGRPPTEHRGRGPQDWSASGRRRTRRGARESAHLGPGGPRQLVSWTPSPSNCVRVTCPPCRRARVAIRRLVSQIPVSGGFATPETPGTLPFTGRDMNIRGTEALCLTPSAPKNPAICGQILVLMRTIGPDGPVVLP